MIATGMNGKATRHSFSAWRIRLAEATVGSLWLRRNSVWLRHDATAAYRGELHFRIPDSLHGGHISKNHVRLFVKTGNQDLIFITKKDFMRILVDSGHSKARKTQTAKTAFNNETMFPAYSAMRSIAGRPF